MINIKNNHIAKYLIAGGSAFASEYILFLILFYYISTSVSLANAASFALGFMVSFLLNKFWVFQAKEAENTKQLLIYALIATFNIFITSIAIEFLVSSGAPAFIAKIGLIACVAFWNFALFKYIVFKTPN